MPVSIPPSSSVGTLGLGALASCPGTGLPWLLARKFLAWLGLCPDPPPHCGVRGLHQVPGIQQESPRTGATTSLVVAWEPGERHGARDKMPFQPKPWKDVCVCVQRLMILALGRGEERGELGLALSPRGAGSHPHTCVSACACVCLCVQEVCAFPSWYIYIRHACILLITCVFLSLFLGLSPTPAKDL